MRAFQLREQGGDLAACEHHRQAHRALGAHQIVEPAEFPAEDLLVEKEQRSERLVLCRCGNLAFGGKMAEKRRHLGLAERGGMALAAPVDETPDPVHVSFLRAPAVMQPTDRLVHLFQ